MQIDAPNVLSAPRPHTRRSRISLPLAKWETLTFKAYRPILSAVEELWWVPELYDDACRNEVVFSRCAKARLRKALSQLAGKNKKGSPRKIKELQVNLLRSEHKALLKLLNEQASLIHAERPHEHLRTAMLSARKMHTLVIRPTRFSPNEPKPEHLNVYAFTSVVAALIPQDDHPPRGITTLRIFDVDLCALLTCAPCHPEAPPLAVDAHGDSFALPPLLGSWYDMHVGWCEIVRDLESLHWAFLRPETYEPRLAQLRRDTGEYPEAQRLRTTEVFQACRYLKQLSLAFHLPGLAHPLPAQSTTSDDPSLDDSSLLLDGTSPEVSHGLSPPSSESPPHTIDFGHPVELDIRFILPYCDAFSGDAPRFYYLRDFTLSTIVLRDSTPLLNFLLHHDTLETCRLDCVAYHFGPGWADNKFLDCFNHSGITALSMTKLAYIDNNTGKFVLEPQETYNFLASMLSTRIKFSAEF